VAHGESLAAGLAATLSACSAGQCSSDLVLQRWALRGDPLGSKPRSKQSMGCGHGDSSSCRAAPADNRSRRASPLFRPIAKKFAVPFDERLTFKLREAVTVLVRLILPHENHGGPICTPKTIYELRVVFEVVVE
jgi:hypothetical protein